MTTFTRFVASLLILSSVTMGLPLTAQAGIVSTDEALTATTQSANRERVSTFLLRDDVRKAL